MKNINLSRCFRYGSHVLHNDYCRSRGLLESDANLPRSHLVSNANRKLMKIICLHFALAKK